MSNIKLKIAFPFLVQKETQVFIMVGVYTFMIPLTARLQRDFVASTKRFVNLIKPELLWLQL